MARLHQGVGLGLDVGNILGLQSCLQIRDGAFDAFFLSCLDLIAGFGKRLSDRVDHGLTLVTGVDQFTCFAILFGVRFRILDHALDLFIRQT